MLVILTLKSSGKRTSLTATLTAWIISVLPGQDCNNYIIFVGILQNEVMMQRHAKVYRHYTSRQAALWRRRRRIRRNALCTTGALLVIIALGIGLWPHPKPPAYSVDLKGQSISFGVATGGALAYDETSYITDQMKKAKQLGVSWIRFDIDWSDVQRDSSQSYDWSRPDRLVAAAQKENLQVLGIVTYTPPWARAPGCTSHKCPPRHSAQFAAFATAAAQRYKNNISAWEIWNEPNRHTPQFDAVAYASLLKEAAVAIKEQDKNTQVLFGGLARSGGTYMGEPADVYLQKAYQNGAKGFFDAVALHPYTFPLLPNSNAGLTRQLQAVQRVLQSNGDKQKPLWITEFSAPTDGAGTPAQTGAADEGDFDYVSESIQAQTAKQVLETYAQLSHKGPFFWFGLQDTAKASDDPEHHFGLLRQNGDKKPAYSVMRQAISSAHHD